MQLSVFQNGVSAALLADASPATTPTWLAALEAQPGFAVYRNTVLKGCIDALQANYPPVCQLVGEDWFRAAAAIYTRMQPPRDGLLVGYGAGFADFLKGFAPAADLPYLPEVARLDRFWTECHLAADAAALGQDWLAQQAPHTLPQTHLQPHPAARWLWSHRLPVYTLWQRHRDGTPVNEAMAWVGDGGLLTRPTAAVTWRALPQAGCAFMDACAAGLPLEAAATAALTTDPATDLAPLLGSPLDAGALVHHPTKPAHTP